MRGVPPSEAKVFSEYVLPSLSLLPSEAELAVQVGAGKGMLFLGFCDTMGGRLDMRRHAAWLYSSVLCSVPP